MKRTKVMTIVGTRPELIRLSRVIACLDAETDHVLVHTGQNYDFTLNEIFLRDLEIRKPDYHLDAAGENVAETIGQIIMRIDPVLAGENPDAVLILGDTNSCLSAIPAKRRHIPIFHMEAGNRCFDPRVPEETNRILIDHLSDINMPYSSIAREYLLREGIAPDRIVKTGSPMSEVLGYYADGIEASRVLAELDLQPLEYFVASAHREENVDSEANLDKLAGALEAIARAYGKPIIVSTHPRTRKRLEAQGIEFPDLVRLMEPLGFFDYIKLQKHSLAVLSDSGTITEESSILNFPALNIREAHERPEGMEEGAVMLVGLESDRILEALEILARQPRGDSRMLQMVDDYNVPIVSSKVLRIIISYIDYVNRFVWLK